jgi:hypothetical protein
MKAKKKDKYYLGAPMTGIENHNRDRLRMYQKFWEDRGYDIVNPGTFFKEEPNAPTARRRSVSELVKCQNMIVLPEWVHWPDSFVNDEMAIARRLGMSLIDGDSYDAPRPLMETVLEEAQRIVYGKRQVDYGHPSVSLNQVAQLWTGYSEAKLGSTVIYQPQDVGNMMILMKIARSINSPSEKDHYVDIAGWAAVLARGMRVDP